MGKIIIVGSNGATGNSLAEKLKKNSLEAHLISRNKEELEKNADKLGFTKSNIDLTNRKDVENFFSNIDFKISGIVFANGAITLKPFSQSEEIDFKDSFNENFLSPMIFLKKSIEHFNDNCSVVFFSTVASIIGFKNHVIVSSIKGSLISAVKSLASEYAPRYRFNCISPSLVDSKMSKFITKNQTMVDGISKLHPLKRIGQGDDLSEMALFLLSEKSSWITGQNFVVDGGRSSVAS